MRLKQYIARKKTELKDFSEFASDEGLEDEDYSSNKWDELLEGLGSKDEEAFGEEALDEEEQSDPDHDEAVVVPWMRLVKGEDDE